MSLDRLVNFNGGTTASGEVVMTQVSAANPLPVVVETGGAESITPVGGASFSIVAGGTAQSAFAANALVTGGFIRNPYSATESLFVDIVNTAQNVAGGGTNGTSVELQPGDTFYLQPSTKAVSVNAVTTAHTFVAVGY